MSTNATSGQSLHRDGRDRAAMALTRWRAELLDLSRRNRLLDLTPNRAALSLSQPTPERLFDGLENQERRFTIYQPPEAAMTVDEQLSLVLGADDAGRSSMGPVTVKGVQRPGAAASQSGAIIR